jgi:hypothetical protein
MSQADERLIVEAAQRIVDEGTHPAFLRGNQATPETNLSRHGKLLFSDTRYTPLRAHLPC